MIAVDLESAPLPAGARDRPAAVVRAISGPTAHPPVSPHAVTGPAAALKSLRLAAPVFDRWAAFARSAAAVGSRQVLLAKPRGYCAGVDRAVETVEKTLELYGSPFYVRKQIVHNLHVVRRLEELGAIFVDETERGARGRDRGVLRRSGVGHRSCTRKPGPATCAPSTRHARWWTKVHAEARRFAAADFDILLIGHEGHEEVVGTTGEAPGSTALIETADDVVKLRPADPGKIAYLMQTTLAVHDASGIVDAILDRFPAAKGPGSDDICYATTNRQRAVQAIAAESDVVLVAGSANSSNSLRLVETAERAGTAAYLVDSAQDIELDWLAAAVTIGVTAGASAPPSMVGEIVDALSGLGPIRTRQVAVATESVRFGLPRELR